MSLLVVAAVILLLLGPAALTEAASSPASSYPVVIDDGKESFLVLDDSEVLQNAEILRYLSTASKEDVEEVVGDNPALTDLMLDKIKTAVRSKAHRKSTEPVAIIKETQQAAVGDKTGEPATDNDDNEDIDLDLRAKVWQSKLKSGASKIFKIGAGFKDKLLAFRTRQTADEATKRGQVVVAKKKSRWPHFHYNVSTSRSVAQEEEDDNQGELEV